MLKPWSGITAGRSGLLTPPPPPLGTQPCLPPPLGLQPQEARPVVLALREGMDAPAVGVVRSPPPWELLIA